MRRKDKHLETLGQNIKKLRIEKGLTQDAFEAFDISYKHFQDIERGLVNPTYLTLLKVAKALKCKVRDLV